MSSLDLYLKLSRLIFGKDECSYLKNYELFYELHQSLCCFLCNNLINEPCFDQKQQKFGCIECLSNNKQQYHTENSTQIKILLKCYKELCEYIKQFSCGKIRDENSLEDERSNQLLQLIELGSRYGTEPQDLEPDTEAEQSDVSPIPIIEEDEDGDDEGEEDESEYVEEQQAEISSEFNQTVSVPSLPAPPLQPPATIVEISPPITIPIVQSSNSNPSSTMILQQSQVNQVPDLETQIPNIITLIPPPPPPQLIQQPINIPQVLSPQPPQVPVPLTVVNTQLPTHSAPLVQYQNTQPITTTNTMPSKKITISPSLTGKPLSTFMGSLGKPQITTKNSNAPIAPIRIARINQPNSESQPTRTLYSVMLTGSGNKITFKRQPADESQNSINKEAKIMSPMHLSTSSSVKTVDNSENKTCTSKPSPSDFKKPIQIFPSPNQPASSNMVNPLKLLKRRGCRCGNATANPGKLTCCGQRCPCYVDSKACIDCKCRGCRNPHIVDGQKKMRHHVPDLIQQQQQQQSYFASLQQQTKHQHFQHHQHQSQPPITQQSEFILDNSSSTSLLNTKSVFSNNSSSTNLINVSNNNGHYQIVSQAQSQQHQKTTPKTMSSMTNLMFPTATTGTTVMSNLSRKIPTTAGIQIVSVYSQIPMMSGNKIIMKNEPVSQSSLTMQNLETSTAPITTVESYVKNSLISSTTMGKPAISQSTTTYYLDESSSKYIMINRDPYETTELTEGVLDQKEVIIEEM